jgi:hypothetical protein
VPVRHFGLRGYGGLRLIEVDRGIT